MGQVGVTSKTTIDGGRMKHIGSHRDLENYRDLVLVLLQKELKIRYTNKILGYLWSIANPLSSAFIYFVAFGLILETREEDYALILISGLFPWQWLSNSVGSSANLFVSKSSLIKKVNFPRNIIPLCSILNHMVHYLASIPVLLVLLLISHRYPTPSWIYGFPLLLVIQFCTAYGIALAISSVNLFFRDLERLVSILLHFLFFLTPILYTADRYPVEYRNLIIGLNPAASLIVNWRSLFLNGSLELRPLLLSIGYATLSLVIGHLVYKKLSWKFAELI